MILDRINPTDQFVKLFLIVSFKKGCVDLLHFFAIIVLSKSVVVDLPGAPRVMRTAMANQATTLFDMIQKTL